MLVGSIHEQFNLFWESLAPSACAHFVYSYFLMHSTVLNHNIPPLFFRQDTFLVKFWSHKFIYFSVKIFAIAHLYIWTVKAVYRLEIFCVDIRMVFLAQMFTQLQQTIFMCQRKVKRKLIVWLYPMMMIMKILWLWTIYQTLPDKNYSNYWTL